MTFHSIVFTVSVLIIPSLAQLNASVWANVAFAPQSAAKTVIVPSATLPTSTLQDYSSVRLTGTITPAVSDVALNFSCLSEGGVRLWVDDFLLIDAGQEHNASAALRGSIQTIPVLAGVQLAFRLEYSRWTAPATPPTLTLYWSGASTPSAIVPPSAFLPDSTPAQQAAAVLRDRLAAPQACPWQTYYRKSATGHTLTPTGLVLLASLVDVQSGSIMSGIFVQRGGGPYVSRAGPHSRNGSDYTQVTVWAWNGHVCNVSMETTVVPSGSAGSAQLSQLQFLATADGVDCGRMVLVIEPTFFDERVGWPANASSGNQFTVALPGFPTVSVAPAGATPIALNGSVAPVGVPYLALPLAPSAVVGYCATPDGGQNTACPPVATMVSGIAAARARALAVSPSLYGNLSDVYEGIATAILWNTVYTVQEGVVAIVSRNPNWGGNSEFVGDYVLFEWDSYFIALQACMEAGMLRDIGMATLAQVTLARTPRGFVPNWKSGPHSSYDRSENQVGALIALRILSMLLPSDSAWLQQLLFPPLLTWHTWVWTSRTAKGGVLDGLPLMILGSDPSTPHDNGDGAFQGARYESMDNSPSYDGPTVAFNGTTHQIMQYDVSPTALFLSDTEALMSLAAVVGRTDVIPLLQQRLNATAAALNEYLWLPAAGSYANRLFNGSFNARLNPSAFYPLLSGSASDDQAQQLTDLLASPMGFCVNSSHTPGLAPSSSIGLLTRWSSRATGHTVGCVSASCADAVLLYGKASFEGVEASVPAFAPSSSASGPVNGVALYLYSSTALSNVTVLATAPPDATFTLVQQEGWCFDVGSAPDPGLFRPWPLTNLTLWQKAVAHDYRTCGTAACVNASLAAGYVQHSVMCTAFDSSTPLTLPCTVPVPSIARGDVNFYDQNYWRGRAWAPQALLVYFALKRYEHLPAVQAAISDLVSLGRSVMLQEWLSFGHIAENLSGLTGFSQDSGDADPFYAWGGCFGMPALLEAGFPSPHAA